MASGITLKGKPATVKPTTVEKEAARIVRDVAAGKVSPATAKILGSNFDSGNDQARFNAMTKFSGGIKADHFRTPIEGDTPRVRQMARILEGLEKSNPALAHASMARLVKDGVEAENA